MSSTRGVIAVGAEGRVDFAVADRLLKERKRTAIFLAGPNDRSRMLRQAEQLAESNIEQEWFVLCDLDDAACAPTFISGLDLARRDWVCLRVAVREIESWLLADPTFADFIAVDPGLIPPLPDELEQPKRAVVAIARESMNDNVRRSIVPSPGSKNVIGRRYNPTLIDFVKHHWQPERAAERSDSLSRCLNALKRFNW